MENVYIVFLDVDGVLFSPWKFDVNYILLSEFNYGKLIPHFDKGALHNLHSLIDRIEDRTNEQVMIVLSSGWRILGEVHELKELFKIHRFSEYMIDKTPHINDVDRGLEIHTWIEQNKHKYNILNFVILDDNDFNLRCRFGKKFIECDPAKLFDIKAFGIALETLLCHEKDGVEKQVVQENKGNNEHKKIVKQVVQENKGNNEHKKIIKQVVQENKGNNEHKKIVKYLLVATFVSITIVSMSLYLS
jgi:hypothetical protein